MKWTSRTSRRLAALGLGVLMVVTAGCSSGTPSGGQTTGASSGRQFTVNWLATITSLDPAFICPGNDNSLASNFYGRLVKLSETKTKEGFLIDNPDPTKVQPDLAESWKISDDGLTYTFKIRSGAKFANGDPLDANAVKYSFDRTLKLGACGALALQGGLTNPPLISGTAAPDATTFVMTLRQPYPQIMYSLALSRGSIYDPKEVEAHGGVEANKPNEWLTSHTASSSGPYVLKTYVPNSYAILEANPNYYGTPAKEKSVRINFLTSVPTLTLQAQNKQADVTVGLPPQTVKEISSKTCCTVFRTPASAPVTVSMNHQDPTTGNAKFREALTYAIPYDDIISKVAYGYGTSFYGPINPTMTGYKASLEPPRKQDVAKAKQLIAESGLTNPELTLMINPTAAGVTEIATIVQSAWQAIGVKVNIDSKAPADFSTLFNGGKYQSALLFENSGQIGAYEIFKKMTCGSSFNNQHICIDGSQKWMDQLNSATTSAQQQAPIDELVKLWVANSATVMLYNADFTAVLNPDVKSFKYSANLRVDEWSR
ncbi:ABC transporter substrate-binding protein [Microbacterium capsulatum]|uniref:ABC transporter substrate-binding protein n=1 Tax=Microbacterium capsulatum TaxID=3041921 RepID=A0ABU0XEP8_9MICO|nr:ABC transporter substrate-binding protein [Microbacterium sp. ASV81]MDQ4213586.1 ABC transporter substrate-binding protein [Microbacterium sp. ASV81]